MIFFCTGNPYSVFDQNVFSLSVDFQTTPGPLYYMLHYNTVLDITLITVGPQLVNLDYLCYMSLHFTLVITQIG